MLDGLDLGAAGLGTLLAKRIGSRDAHVQRLLAVPDGDRHGSHWDSAEEVLLVREGEAELEVGTERLRLRAGGVAVAPALVPHTVYSVGEATLKITSPTAFAGVFLS